MNVEVKKIVITHNHYDHIAGLEKVRNQLKAEVYVNKKDNNINADRMLKEGDKINIGNVEFEIIETPGHTPGGICLYCRKENILFSGDTLFPGGVGSTAGATANVNDIVKSVKEKLFRLPEETMVYPGHGKKTKIEKEINNKNFLWK